MNETLEVLVVTIVAAAALMVLVRGYLPGRQKPSKPTGCSTCGSHTAVRERRTGPQPPRGRTVH